MSATKVMAKEHPARWGISGNVQGQSLYSVSHPGFRIRETLRSSSQAHVQNQCRGSAFTHFPGIDHPGQSHSARGLHTVMVAGAKWDQNLDQDSAGMSGTLLEVGGAEDLK